MDSGLRMLVFFWMAVRLFHISNLLVLVTLLVTSRARREAGLTMRSTVSRALTAGTVWTIRHPWCRGWAGSWRMDNVGCRMEDGGWR